MSKNAHTHSIPIRAVGCNQIPYPHTHSNGKKMTRDEIKYRKHVHHKPSHQMQTELNHNNDASPFCYDDVPMWCLCIFWLRFEIE